MKNKQSILKFLTVFILSMFCIQCSSFWNKKETSHEEKKAALHLKLGASHFQNENYHKALKEFITADELDPRNPVILNNLGITYFALKRLPLGEKFIRKALNEQPDYTEARLNLAKLLIEIGLYQEALNELAVCDRDLTFPRTDTVNYYKGLALYKLSNYIQAEENFKSAVAKNPDHCLATFFYGRTLFELKMYQTASESLDKSIKLCDKYKLDGAHFYSALSHYRVNNLNLSMTRLEELLKLYPKTKYAQDAHEMLRLLK